MNTQISDFVQANHGEIKGALYLAAVWIVREFYPWTVKTAWPALKSIYPWLAANGGVFGVVKNFFCGKKIV